MWLHFLSFPLLYAGGEGWAETSTTNNNAKCRPIARIIRRGATWVSDVYVCMHKHARLGGLGAYSPRKFLGIRCSEIASEAILGQKQNCSSYMTHRVLYPIFGCPYALICWASWHQICMKVLSLAEQQVGFGIVQHAENTGNTCMSEEHQAYTPCMLRFHVFTERWFDFSLFSCRFIVGGESLKRTIGELLSAWNSNLFTPKT